MTLKDFIRGPLACDRSDAAAAREVLARDDGPDADEEGGRHTRSSRQEFRLVDSAPLFEYQQEVIDSVRRLVAKGERRAMVSLPTGGGKTRTALWLFRSELERNALRRMLWVAPSVELVDQAVSALRDMWQTHYPSPSLQVIVNDIGSVRQGTEMQGCAVFATTQLASRRPKDVKAFGPDLLVYDEAHQAAARTSRALIRAAQAGPGAAIVGLSATPGRSLEDESEMLSALFDGNLVTPRSLGPDPVAALRKQGVLARVVLSTIPLPDQWKHIRVSEGSQATLSIHELALNHVRFWATVDATMKIAKRRRCLVFGASIAHCHAIRAALVANGLRAEVLSHNTPAEDRGRVLHLFRAGGIDVLLNKSILVAGFDLPELEDVILATPIRSAIQWEQIVGRVSRGPAVGGTPKARVWELDDHQGLHDRVLSAQRFAGEVW